MKTAEFAVPTGISHSGPQLLSYEDKEKPFTPIPSFDAPDHYKFRSHILVSQEKAVRTASIVISYMMKVFTCGSVDVLQ